jgi:hypothetical protein
LYSRFAAAILEKRVEISKKKYLRFVVQSYTGKVTEAFLKIPSGYGASEKRSAWG